MDGRVNARPSYNGKPPYADDDCRRRNAGISNPPSSSAMERRSVGRSVSIASSPECAICAATTAVGSRRMAGTSGPWAGTARLRNNPVAD